MILTFADDFGTNVLLDSELRGASDSGLFWNRGVHSLVTIANLIALLPVEEITFADYSAATPYSKFTDSRNRSDIVKDSNKLYQSVANANVGNVLTDANFWLETNIESIRIKAFLFTTFDNYKSALSLNKSLIENQYIYNVARNLTTLGNDYSGWAFEPKGSDYVKIVINQMSLQANTTDPVSVYVINQGRLIETITLNPNNGLLEFEDVGETIYGKGPFYFVFESQEVFSDSEYIDPLKYNGFTCYAVSGIGATAETSNYSINNTGNGLNFNVSAYLDSTVYLDNNEVLLAKFIQSQFEMDTLNLIYYNPNSNSNRSQRNVASTEMLATEILDTTGNTAARRYQSQLKVAKKSISSTFDKFLKPKQSFVVKQRTI
jgi:hypothetical protein